MKKIIIGFIILVFLLAFLANQQHEDDVSYNEINAEEAELDEYANDALPLSQDSLYNHSKEKSDSEIDTFSLLPEVKIQIPEQIIKRYAYTVSYNKDTRCPNWVAWRLTADHTDGEVSRDRNYYEDEDVPKPRATSFDYKGSGWTRGHMCPAGDNKWSEQAMQESNLLTNICPQHASLNSGVWNVIERNCRDWAQKYGDLYIVCGPIYLNQSHETIGYNEIVVPEAFFKVILCLTDEPKAIGFVVRNNAGKKKRDQFINTIDDVERITKIDFFPALPDSIESDVESKADIDEW